MDNELEEKAIKIREEIEQLEDRLAKLKEEERQIALYVMNKSNGNEGLLNILESDILNYEEGSNSTYFSKQIEDKNIRVFVCLNRVDADCENQIRSIVDNLLPSLNSDNVDDRYIKLLESAKECSKIITGDSTFTLLALDNSKTYAFAEGKANIYIYNNEKIEVLNLTNKIGELTYEVVNNNDYIRLILFSYSNIEDLKDNKVKIITKKTDRETLIKTLI